MTLRVTAFLALSAVFSATLAAAPDDGPPPGTPADSSSSASPPPAQFAPLTHSERLSLYLGGLVNGESIVRAAAAGGISQASGTPDEWGGGFEGYGRRVGNSFAQHLIRDTLQYGVSAALHEDNRYFVSGETGFMRRTKYAIKSTLLARHDNGTQSFSFSRFGSAAGSAFISRAWQPHSTTSVGDGATTFGITIASDLGFNVFREFWPDMKHRMRKGH